MDLLKDTLQVTSHTTYASPSLVSLDLLHQKLKNFKYFVRSSYKIDKSLLDNLYT